LTDNLLRESLGFLVSDISPLNEANILVEGEFDRELLIEANKKFKILDLNEVSIIACGKASNIQKHASLYVANGLTIVGLYDADASGKGAMSSALNVSKLNLQEVIDDVMIETMEDMLPSATYLEGVAEWKKKLKLKKTFTADMPRMSQINAELSGQQDKMEYKHLLEDSLVEAFRTNIKSKATEFQNLQTLLTKLKEKLDEVTKVQKND